MNVFQFNNLSKFKNVTHGISTREFGTMKNENGSRNIKNLNNFLKTLKFNGKLVGMQQIHGNNIGIVSDEFQDLIGDTDGLITAKKNIGIYVLIADCLPILFYDSRKQIIGAAHAGRKGLQLGVIKNMIEKFKNEFGSDTSDIMAGVGPGIEKKCYEFEGEFLDIRKIANEQLLENGILEKNIENMDICTKCYMDKFYSYRGGDGNERFATVISFI